MEIYMKNISYMANKNDVKAKIAEVLHGPRFANSSSLPLNLEVYLFRDKKGNNGHSGSGALTLPSEAVGSKFLTECGGPNPKHAISVRNKRIIFEQSKRSPRTDVVGNITHLPYLDPHAVERKEQRTAQLEVDQVYISDIQFGWECRDEVFSCEWEKSVPDGSKLFFEDDRREFRATFGNQHIRIKTSQIEWTAAGMEKDRPVVHFSLASPPTFEAFGLPMPSQQQQVRTRISYLDRIHERVVPYASLQVRFICSNRLYLKIFRTLCTVTHMRPPSEDVPQSEYRNLFSDSVVETYNSWLKLLKFEVAFQVESIVRKLLVDLKEMLSLREAIFDIAEAHGNTYLTGFLRQFSILLKDAWEEGPQQQSVMGCFQRCRKDHVPGKPKLLIHLALDDAFDCLHVTFTPTTMHLDGPFPERSNRVFRMYPDSHSCFVRVNFADETHLQLRFDREVDGQTFVKERVGKALHEGITIGGRHFRFLAYSQSALKEHAVWFMRPFYDKEHNLVHTDSIVSSLGNFGVDFDRTLMYCPGRYGARISQAFTATDSSVSVEPEEIIQIKDITRPKNPSNPAEGTWTFTDGVGTISAELAKEIWKALRERRRKARRAYTYPRCYQIRFMGCKGMVSVNYQLQGRAICVRPSMTKFDAPKLTHIEIARAFDRPSLFYLNRPLIMVLEGLGIPHEIFQVYQDAAVRNAEDSIKDLDCATKMLESFGLGASYRLPSVMLHLHKLGVRMPRDDFYQTMMEFAINHVLRELKHHARIPIPGWTLVGVVDVHNYLAADEIFACVQAPDTGKKTYLEGCVVVTRSPVIHPGDILVVRAIGRPPEGSPFEIEPLANSIVFSTKGKRPLPSMAGGGDCDGDTFNITPLENLPVRKTCAPAAYTDAPKRLLSHPCTMDDVADFVVDYINSDVLGLIAITWLIIADQSRQDGVFDKDCLELAQLHSDAVDYPKSSTPVPLNKIPKLKFKAKPDWNRPETMGGGNANYYESQRAIGKLFRAIKLPALKTVQRVSRRQRHQLGQVDTDEDSLVYRLGRTNLADITDEIGQAVYDRVSQFIEPEVDDDYLVHASELFDNYVSSLRSICASYTLSQSRDGMLTEEEAVVGTIVAKTSQPRMRKDMMSKLREQTLLLVKSIRDDIAGDDDSTLETTLRRAWTCWMMTLWEKETFGAQSFGFIALGCIFDTVKAIENVELRWL